MFNLIIFNICCLDISPQLSQFLIRKQITFWSRNRFYIFSCRKIIIYIRRSRFLKTIPKLLYLFCWIFNRRNKKIILKEFFKSISRKISMFQFWINHFYCLYIRITVLLWFYTHFSQTIFDIFLMGRKKLNILLSYSRLNRFRTRPKARWIELDTDW